MHGDNISELQAETEKWYQNYNLEIAPLSNDTYPEHVDLSVGITWLCFKNPKSVRDICLWAIYFRVFTFDQAVQIPDHEYFNYLQGLNHGISRVDLSYVIPRNKYVVTWILKTTIALRKSIKDNYDKFLSGCEEKFVIFCKEHNLKVTHQHYINWMKEGEYTLQVMK